MSVTEILVDIVVVLLAAKIAAEIAERIGIPAVIGEIMAGIIVGPAVLGMLDTNEVLDVLDVLGELGVILLLLEVGLELSVRDLRAGRTGPRQPVALPTTRPRGGRQALTVAQSGRSPCSNWTLASPHASWSGPRSSSPSSASVLGVTP